MRRPFGRTASANVQRSERRSFGRPKQKIQTIRTARNLLGGEQSGHIANVGFDLYVRLVGEAVAEFKGDSTQEMADVRIELPVDAHLPHGYIPGERLRLEAYRKIAEIDGEDRVEEVRAELADRYGELPAPVANLLEVARFRTRARRAGLREVALQGNYIRFAPVDLRESQTMRLQRLYPATVVKPTVKSVLIPRPMTARVGGRPVGDLELLLWAVGVIDAVIDEPVPAVSG